MNKLEFDVHSLLSFSWSIESRNQRNLQILHILPSGLILKLPPVKLLNFPNSSISRHSGENPPVPQWGKSIPCHSGENPSSDTEGKWIKLSKRSNVPEPPLWLASILPHYLSITTIITYRYRCHRKLVLVALCTLRSVHSWYWKILPWPWCWKHCSCRT